MSRAEPFDDPSARTRFAWLRTALGVVAVSALLARGLVMDSVPSWVLAAAMLPAAGFAALAFVRMRSISDRQDHAVSPRAVLLTSMLVMALAAGGIAAALPD